MPLERFIPKSPDSFIRNSQDFEVAKFGHLNTIVEYINSYVVADSLQLSGVGPLSATLRNITDAAGTYSKLLISTTSTAVSSDLRFLGNISGYVAIQAPDNVTTYTLKLPTTTGTNGQAIVTDGSGNLSFATVTTNAAGSTGQVQFNNANAFAASSNLFWDNTNSRLGVGTSSPTAPLHVVGGTYSPQGVTINAGTRFSTGGSDYGSDSLSSVGGGPMTLRAYYYTIINRANAGIAAQCLEIQGQTLIKGSGSTSATTSLLVQNSGGDQIFKVTDNGSCTIGRSGSTLTALEMYDIFGLNSRFGNGQFECPPTISRVSNGTVYWYTRNNDGQGITFEHNNSQQSSSTGIAMVNIGGGYATNNNAQFSSLQIAPAYDLSPSTGTSSIARGIYYNPTITNLRVAQHRAIETTSGNIIFNGGNVGIGTSSPAYPLDVNGSIRGKNDAYFGYSNIASGNTYIQIQPDKFNSKIIFNDFDGGTSSRGGIVEFGTYYGRLFYGNYNWFHIGNYSYPYRYYMKDNTANVIISQGNVAPTDSGALFQVKGTGSTSATTSLLVQNSGGTDMLRMRDDGVLLLGTTASGLGTIYVPYESSFGERVFMAMQGGGRNLFSTISNDGLGIKADYVILSGGLYTNGSIYGSLIGTAGSGLNTMYRLGSQFQPYGSADLNYLYSGAGGRLQGGSTASFLSLAGSFTIDSFNTFRGFYFNPTLSGSYNTNCIRAIESSYGGAYFNTTLVNASAILQADSTTQGFLPPRMTTAQKNAIATPAAGLVVYDTDLNKLCVYTTTWQTITSV